MTEPPPAGSPPLPSPPRKKKRWPMLLVRIACSAGLMAWLLNKAGFQNTLDKLGQCRIEYLLAALGLYCVGQALSAFKWQWIARFLKATATYLEHLRMYFVGMFFSLFLPTIIGGDVYRIAALSSASHKRPAVTAASVLIERLTGLYGLVAVALIGAVAIGRPVWGVPLWLPIAALLAVMIVAALLMPRPGPLGKMAHLGTLVPKTRFSRALRVLHLCFLRFRGSPRALVPVLAISLGFQLLTTVVVLLVGLSLNITGVGWAAYVAFVPIISLATMVPLSINGVGIREAAYVFLFALLGVATESCIALSLLHMGTTMLAALVGGGVYLVFGSGMKLDELRAKG